MKNFNISAFWGIICTKYWVVIPIALLLFLRIPALFWGWHYGDENIYLAIASDLNHGEWLYAETWDNKPPVLYILYAVIYFLFGPAAWIYRLISTILGACTVWLFWQIFGHFWKERVRLQKSTTILFAITWGLMFEAPLLNGENLFVPLVLAGWLITLKKINLEKTAPLLIAGIFWALASATKIHAFAEIVTMVWMVLIVLISTQKSRVFIQKIRKIVPTIAILITPTLLLFAAIITFFWNAGFLHQLYIGTIGFSSQYVSNKAAMMFGLAMPFLTQLQLSFILTAVTILLLTFYFLRGKISQTKFLLLGWLTITVFGAFISNRPYPHYVLQTLPAAFLVASAVVHKCKQNVWADKTPVYLASLLTVHVFLSGFAAPIGSLWNYYGPHQYFAAFTLPFTGKVNAWREGFDPKVYAVEKQNVPLILQNSQPSDSIYVYGNDPVLYGLTHRRSAAGHVTVFNIANWDEVFDEIKMNQPRLILIEKTRLDAIPNNLSEFLAKNYTEINQTDSYLFFVIN